MRRREFVAFFGGAAARAPRAATLQQLAKVARIGFWGDGMRIGS
jgi:hypothetical protein